MITEKDLEDYGKLIERVDEIDSKAADYLRGLLDQDLSEDEFSPDGMLDACIVFKKTPQGNKYWWGIQDKLEEEV